MGEGERREKEKERGEGGPTVDGTVAARSVATWWLLAAQSTPGPLFFHSPVAYHRARRLEARRAGRGRGCSCDHRLAKEEDDDVGAQQAETRVFSNDCGGLRQRSTTRCSLADLEVQPQWIDRQATARRDVVRLQERGRRSATG